MSSILPSLQIHSQAPLESLLFTLLGSEVWGVSSSPGVLLLSHVLATPPQTSALTPGHSLSEHKGRSCPLFTSNPPLAVLSVAAPWGLEGTDQPTSLPLSLCSTLLLPPIHLRVNVDGWEHTHVT